MAGVLASPIVAQPAAPQAVRVTAALAHTVRETVTFTGSVEARRVSVVAAEVDGRVAHLHAREGTAVRRDEPLAELDREGVSWRLAAVRGEVAEAEAELESARLRLERRRQLERSQVIPPQDVDDAAYEAEALTGRLARLRADAARLERDLANTTVRAPFDGVVTAEHCEVGEWVSVGDPVVVLLAPDELEVRLAVPERYFAGLRPGVPVGVRLPALGGEVIAGVLRTVVPSADPQARTFPALVRLDTRGHRLGAGMLAEVELPVGEPRPAVMVPKDAVVSDGARRVVYVLNGTSEVEAVPVRTGPGAGLWVAVEGSVKAGAQVVTRGNERLVEGRAVEPQPLEYAPPPEPSP